MRELAVTFPIKAIENTYPRMHEDFAYTPKQLRVYQSEVKRIALLVGQKPMCGWLTVELDFRFKKPIRTDFEYPSKGSLDNFTKAITDALTGVFWLDGCQIVGLHVSKSWGVSDEILCVVQEIA